jgi:hypothetical protein
LIDRNFQVYTTILYLLVWNNRIIKSYELSTYKIFN